MLALGLVAPLVPVPTAAAAPLEAYVTMHSEGEYIGGGLSRLFDSATAQVSLAGGTNEINVVAAGGPWSDRFTLSFAAPAGARLGVGTYLGAERTPFREAGRPGLDVSGSGRGCNTVTGWFDVLDIAYDASGRVRRVWLVYEHHCNGGTPSLFGEVRIGYGAPVGLRIATRKLDLPAGFVGAAGTATPVTVIAPADRGVVVSKVVIDGMNAADFPIRTDECTGRTLPAGGSCAVFVRATPATAGPRFGRLSVTDSGGTVRTVELTGWGVGGRTRWAMSSDPGEYIGQGRTYDYTPANARLDARGNRSALRMIVYGNDGADFEAELQAPSGDVLAPGRYTGAQRAAFRAPGAPGLEVTGSGRGCNTLTGEFTISSISFSASGDLEHFAASFVQHCEGGTAALRGTLEYLVPTGDTAAPAAVPQAAARALRGGVDVTWGLPGDTDLAAVVVRYYPGRSTPLEPTRGLPLAAGRSTSATLRGVPGGVSYTFTVSPIDSSGNVGPTRVLRVPGTVLTTAASPTAVSPGGAAAVTARLAAAEVATPYAGQRVSLYYRTATSGGWRGLTVLTTDRDGRVRLPVAPRTTTSYRAWYPGTSAVLGSASPIVTVTVR